MPNPLCSSIHSLASFCSSAIWKKLSLVSIYKVSLKCFVSALIPFSSYSVFYAGFIVSGCLFSTRLMPFGLLSVQFTILIMVLLYLITRFIPSGF